VGDTTDVVTRSDWGKPEPSVEILRWELRGKRDFPHSGLISSFEEKPHYLGTRALPACFWDRRNPRHQCLASIYEREGQPACGDRPALAAACHGWWKCGKGDHAARVVGVGDAEIGDPLLLGKDPAPYFKRRKSLVGTDRGYHLDPR